MEQKKAAEILEVHENEVTHFAVEDLFNSPNTLEGFLCKRSDHRYGALVLTKVNGEEVPHQVVYGTPKQRYPFKMRRGERYYLWPKVILAVKTYEKLDGTNILAYSYQDAEGTRFTTFKTRLTPVVRNGVQANHRDLWKTLLKEQTGLLEASEKASEEVSVAFEMYGYSNPLLIAYEKPLEAKVIFGVSRKDASVLVPDEMGEIPETVRVKLSGTFEGSDPKALSDYFEKRQNQSEEKNHKKGEQIEGTEGEVFYLQEVDGWHQYKCKAPSVESIHRLNGGELSESVVYPTALNALESVEGILTVEYVQNLLLEEFCEEIVERSLGLVRTIVNGLNEKHALIKKVKGLYETSGMTYEKDGRGGLMRYFSQNLEKEEMKKVFFILQNLGHVPR